MTTSSPAQAETDRDSPAAAAGRGAAALRVLVLSRDLGSGGGVVGYVGMLMQALRGQVQWDHLVTGRRPGERGMGALPRLLGDYLAFAWRLLTAPPDLIHLNPSFIGKALPRDLAFVALAALLGRAPLLVFIHGWSWPLYERLLRRPALASVVAWLLGRATRIVVLSDQFRDALAALGLPAGRIEVVTTMFDGAELNGVRAQAPGVGPLRLLFLARVTLEKGVVETIEALKLLVDGGIDAQLLVAGDGPDLELAREAARRLALDGRIRFLGYVRGADKCAAFAAAHVYVLASQREGCPVSLLEAMACGLPVVATAVGGIPDVVRSGESGALIDRVAPEAIAAAVRDVASTPDRWQCLADASHRRAWQHYESTAVAARMLQLYRQHPDRA